MSYKLIIIILLGLFLRFAFFPHDISFTYDQARDAYAASEIAHLHLKIIGPPTVVPGVFHGVLAYYFLAPLYFISHGDPVFPAAIFRVINLLGVLVVYLIGKKMFSSSVGLIAAFLFAVSFEQTQFALFFGHPALAVLPILLFYFFLISKRFSCAAFCLGLAIQFHFAQITLVSIFLAYLLLNREKLTVKNILSILLAFIFSLSSFILAELKFGFRTTQALLHGSNNQTFSLTSPILVFQRYVTDNLTIWPILGVILLLLLLFVPRHRTILILWLLGGLAPYLLDHSTLPIYYYTIGGSVSLVIICAYYLAKLPKIISASILIFIVLTNLSNISQHNPTGVIPAITVQSGMLLSDQKRLIDKTYSLANNQTFGINALSIPYHINTTWSYLYGTYGHTKYGYTPVWVGDTASGFGNQLEIVTNRSQTPDILFTIIEPTRGLDPRLHTEYLANEDIFTTIKSETPIGQFTLQHRQKK